MPDVETVLGTCYIELSKEYDMYRQDYCGCVFSYRDRQQQKAQEMED